MKKQTPIGYGTTWERVEELEEASNNLALIAQGESDWLDECETLASELVGFDFAFRETGDSDYAAKAWKVILELTEINFPEVSDQLTRKQLSRLADFYARECFSEK